MEREHEVGWVLEVDSIWKEAVEGKYNPNILDEYFK